MQDGIEKKKEIIMKRIIALIAVVDVSCCFSADVATWAEASKNYVEYDVNGSGGWNDATRWKGGKVPGPQNAVKIEFADDVVINDKDLNVFTNVYWYSLINSRITFDCTVDVKYPGCFRSGSRSRFVKVGDNRLEFIHLKDTYCNYSVTDFIVSNGCLRLGNLYPYESLSPLVEVWKPGVLELWPDGNTKVLGVVGDGVVTNTSTVSRQLTLWSHMDGGSFGAGPWIFSGTQASSVKIAIGDESNKPNSWSEQNFMGVANVRKAFSVGFPQIFHGFIGVEDPGFGSECLASIPGTCCQFYGADCAGPMPYVGFRYLGKGGITDMQIDYYNKYGKSPLVIDAGAIGGLTFAVDGDAPVDYRGSWRNLCEYFYSGCDWATSKKTDVTAAQFILTGSNVNACVISNNIVEGSSAPYMCFIKRGTGTWRFAERNEDWCGNKGPILVEQGRLEFDSFTALGKGTKPYTNFWGGVTDEDCRVQYIYRIGNGTNDVDAVDLATMAYLGDAQACSSRRFAVCGAGRIENGSDAGGLELTGGIFSDCEGDNTLALSGPGVNSLTDVTNGIGTLSIIKEDVGEWTLKGNVLLTFAEVKCGILKFDGPSTCPGLKVDGDASFEAKASNLAVDRLRFDAEKGIGSIKGAVFAESGTVELNGTTKGFSSLELGGSFYGSAGLENVLRWQLLIDGERTTRYVLSLSSDGLKVCRRGMSVVIR